MSKTILGLDLGTNSIGWSLVKSDFNNKSGEILGAGVRVLPMSQDIIGDFGKGNSISQTAERTRYRSVRRLRERYLLRRERLHRVLNIYGFLPEHYASQIDFDKRLGKFKANSETKLAYDDEGFIFQKSFQEMLNDFRDSQPNLLENDKKIPYDWTIYYLRKKAITEKIEKGELAWIILNFNQKRGYYQLRGEEEAEVPNKKVEFYSLSVKDVVADEAPNSKGDTWYSIILDNGWVYRRSSKISLDDWIGKVKDFIVTTDLSEDGKTEKTDREGNVKRSFRAPSEDDWTLIKKKTEKDVEDSHKTVGAYIYDNLLQNPKQKIKGKLIRTIERKFYKDELRKILQKQQEFHPELRDESLLKSAIADLYKNNEAHRNTLEKRDFAHFILEDIIFYQRPLKSQKSSIANCPLEFRTFKDKQGNQQKVYLKATPKSNPYFQEFRLWQWLQNLSIYSKLTDENVTAEFLSAREDYVALFEFLNDKREITQNQLIEFLIKRKNNIKKVPKSEVEKYRWNFVQDKTYPGNETRALIKSRLEKVSNVTDDFLDRNIQELWHIIYSVTDKQEYEKAIKSYAEKNSLNVESFYEAFRKVPPFKSDYASFSEKAIKKLLPLMRLGKYWKWDEIETNTQDRIQKIIDGEFDEKIDDRVREKAAALSTEEHFQGLPLWLAQYVVYGRHSETDDIGKWNSSAELESFISEFRQHSLRNPIVEQVVTETLRVVRDIWEKFGNGEKDFFSEIHIELGREMKLPADERKRLTNTITENENTNLRIKALLAEMAADNNVENVRPFSPMQQELLKVYEEGVLLSQENIDDDIIKISKTAQPSSADLKKYKLWLEQKYRSPYTGQIIPLNKLFTTEYEIEHIIPQSRYFDDSLSNKIICETAVNKLKSGLLGYNFIRQFGGSIVECGFGKTVTVSQEAAYKDFVNKTYEKNRAKRSKLLMDEIPEKMIERQMNDTRYISKYISSLLSKIVRNDVNDDGVNSINLVQVNGKITTRLKQDWGLNDVWNDLILPRFERMNSITNSSDFTAWNENHQKYLPTVPIELSKGFSKKRIDHRHHALDAIVIACATKDHINLLNNQSAKSDTKRYDLKRKLMTFEKVKYTDAQTGKEVVKDVPKLFLKPWETFTKDAKDCLVTMVISFKQNLRVINKATNYYEKYVEENGEMVKKSVAQTGTNWAIRKPMHKETVSGLVELPWLKIPKGKIATATRKAVDATFNLKTIASITDTGIQKILKNYLQARGGNPEIAFSPEGIAEMNANIEKYNDGKYHQPIFKVRIFEVGNKFPLGYKGNKKDKFVEAAKGTNLFFAVYQSEDGKRSFETIPLNEVIERQKQGLPSCPEENAKGEKLLFSLSPNDLVYVNESNIDLPDTFRDLERIYKIVSFTGNRLYGVPYYAAKAIYDKVEYTQLNKVEFALTGESIKLNCIKLNVDRLGNISKANI
ncbi:type II CRISPR RNA-guided endonuclease Cas9 [Cruoricaptor ignavus]|uniref:CRISPR-associated endonuclease Cas9 n=1 Tax=Cruoricaptor ignavus TaxID=1118202 RepID=A0A7M1T683_9FLAO|nr:type II CRISPR RNA-guided endonuclease Cas9 [Cruoricaptor ignavus]QOR74382.1 type II CRISPR RNA-guided endonuclease Cas9 [Cruoricaptor ignavus]